MTTPTNPPRRVVVCAALRHGETIILGARHFDRRMHATIARLRELGDTTDYRGSEQGFIDQFGEFLTRQEALEVAEESGQRGARAKHSPGHLLFSEDLY